MVMSILRKYARKIVRISWMMKSCAGLIWIIEYLQEAVIMPVPEMFLKSSPGLSEKETFSPRFEFLAFYIQDNYSIEYYLLYQSFF